MNDKYYKILEITDEDRRLSADELMKKIKSNYRKLSKQYHPDVNNDEGAIEKMAEVNEAYGVLTGKEKPKNQSQNNPFGGHNPFAQVRRVRPLQLIVDVTLEEVFNGVEKDITYNRNLLCSECGGAGGKEPTVCPHCSGQGFIPDPHTSMGMKTVFMCNTCAGSGQVFSKQCGRCHGSGSKPSVNKVKNQNT